jgi:hypothetical protein
MKGFLVFIAFIVVGIFMLWIHFGGASHIEIKKYTTFNEQTGKYDKVSYYEERVYDNPNSHLLIGPAFGMIFFLSWFIGVLFE